MLHLLASEIWVKSRQRLGQTLGQNPLSLYLVKVQNVYHYRRYVPPDVRPDIGNRQWWKRSLKTGELRIAEARARSLAVEHDRLIEGVRQQQPSERLETVRAKERAVWDSGKATARRLAAQRPELLQPAYAADGSARIVEALPRSWHRQFVRTTVARIETELAVVRQQVIAAKDKLTLLTLEEVAAIEKSGGLEEFVEGVRDLLRALEVTERPLDEEAWEEWEVRRQIRLRRLDQQLRMLAKLGIDIHQHDDPDNPRIKRAVETWLQERKQGIAAQRRHRVAVRRFLELHGNVPVRDVTREMVRDYVKKIENLADHRHLPTKQRGGLADPGSDVPRVSAKTVERHLISVKALLAFATEQGWTTANTAMGIKAPRDTRPKASRRRPFSREERIKILSQAIEEGGEDGDMSWLIRLAAYTGARLEELASLPCSNVCEIDGVSCIEIDDLNGRSAKTVGSVRSIPLHPQIAEPFVGWVSKRRAERVFLTFKRDRDGRFANGVSGDFARLMDRAGLNDARLTFHSMRHTLKREMSNAGVDPDVRRSILGHAPKDAHDGYAGPSVWAISEQFAKLPPLF